jgi:hypothetical protein
LNDPPGGGTRHYWEEKAKEIVGYGKDVDVIEMNRRITAAYAEMYLRSPSKFLWAGMAALASCDVGKGMIQAKILKKEAGTVAVGVGALATGMPTGTELMEALAVGNLYVYADMYSQHLAYSQGGLEEMKRLRDRGELSASCYDAWEKIDRGQVWEGNRLLLKWEQETTLQKAVYDQHPDAFKKLSWLARYMPALLDSPIPGDGNSFTKVVPNGNLGLFADRWKWIEQSMLPAWKKLVEHNQNEVRQSMEGFLKGKFHRPG